MTYFDKSYKEIDLSSSRFSQYFLFKSPHLRTFLPLTLNKILRQLHRLRKAVLQYLKPHSRRKVVDLNTFGLVSENLYQKSLADNISAFLVDPVNVAVR